MTTTPLEVHWYAMDVACPACKAPAGKVCERGGLGHYYPLHSQRHVYARKLTTGPEVGDVLYILPHKYRLGRDGAWRNHGRPVALPDDTTVDYDAVAGMWRVKADGPRFLFRQVAS